MTRVQFPVSEFFWSSWRWHLYFLLNQLTWTSHNFLKAWIYQKKKNLAQYFHWNEKNHLEKIYFFSEKQTTILWWYFYFSEIFYKLFACILNFFQYSILPSFYQISHYKNIIDEPKTTVLTKIPCSKSSQVTIRHSIVVSISACHADDPGSIPGVGVFCLIYSLLPMIRILIFWQALFSR